MNKILVINDISSYGKVASSAIIPILSSMGYDISVLPTALVSNVFDFGKFEVLDLSDYIKRTLEIWDSLNFNFDCVYTGFINSDEQFDIIKNYIKKNKCDLVVIDPVMGDDGEIYPGLSKDIVINMKNFISCADVITPNITEAAYLLGKNINNLILDENEIKEWIQSLRSMGPKSIVITSVKLKYEDSYYIYGYDDNKGDYIKIKYEFIGARFPGTGDVFASKLVGSLLNNKSLEESCKEGAIFVKDAIKESLNYNYSFKEGMKIEKLLCI